VLRRALGRYPFARFLAGGGFNTAVTYLLYLALLKVFDYRISYTVSYLCGILLAYFISGRLVFKVAASWRSALLFPFIYLTQYVLGLAIVFLWVHQLSLPRFAAPLAAVAITLPITYLMSRTVFRAEPEKPRG